MGRPPATTCEQGLPARREILRYVIFQTYPVTSRQHVATKGQSHQDKLKLVREELKKKEAKAIVVNMLDEVAWLFNLRGSDIDFNPGQSPCYCSLTSRA